ncbi:MAG: alpha/beta hydrolase [Candidatus Thorarchaeota archaeon]
MNIKSDNKIIPGAEPFHLAGKGPKVLLIHGFTATPTEMRPIGDFLNKHNFEVYSILLPGHGTSPEDLKSKKWIDWWEATKKKFEEINNCDFVIGFSMGALLASRLAVEFKDKIKGLVLISTFINVKPIIYSKLSFLFPIIGLFRSYINKSPETGQFFKDNNLISYLKYPVSASYEAIKLAKFTQKTILKQITAPTLIIQGIKDDRVDPNNYKILERTIPAENKVTVLLPESQHIVTVGPDKELLFNSIYDFLKDKE